MAVRLPKVLQCYHLSVQHDNQAREKRRISKVAVAAVVATHHTSLRRRISFLSRLPRANDNNSAEQPSKTISLSISLSPP